MALSHRPLLAACAAFLLSLFPLRAAGLTIVDVVADSDESAQNSEPSIAVNPANPDEIFITAFNDFDNVSFEPQPSFVYSSGTAGAAWSVYQQFETLDASIAWPDGGRPYLTHLFGSETGFGAVMLVRAAALPVAGSRFEIIPAGTYAASDIPDQPWIVASRAAGQDRLYITYNDFNSAPRTAAIQFSLDGGATWQREVLERKRPGAGQDGPPVRSAVQGDTVYVAFQRWDDFTFSGFNGGVAFGELVIVKDTDAGRGGFRALGAAGVGAVAQGGLRFPFGSGGLGQERTGSGVSIAIDPNDAEVVFVATEIVEEEAQHIAVFRSTDGGRNWCHCYDTRPRTGLPALAIAANGTIGLEYTGSFNGLLETHLLQTPDRFFTVADTTLSRFIDNSLVPSFDPFIGDYQRLVAVGNTFHGTFSASNDTSLYPSAVTFVRDRSRLGFRVPYSIDPFYFNTPATTTAPPVAPPSAVDDIVTFQNFDGVEINVLANDADPAGDTITVVAISDPPSGFAFITDTGKIGYSQGSGFTGRDSFTYTIANSVGKTATATVSLRNPFYEVRGAFTGLGLGEKAATTGSLKGNLLGNGGFSAKLRLGNESYTLTGKFDLDGEFIATLSRPSGQALTVQLALDFDSATISGTVGDGVFRTVLDAGLASFTIDNPAPQAGAYTFALDRAAGDPAGVAFVGSGYGRVKVGATGQLRVLGALPDGAPFTFGGQVTNDGRWFLYASVSGGPEVPIAGSLAGIVTFADLPETDFTATPIRWVRPNLFLVPPLGDGFTTEIELTGSRYEPPDFGSRAFLDDENGRGLMTLAGTGTASFNFRLNRNQHGWGDPAGAQALDFLINPRTGFLTGNVNPPGPTTIAPLSAAVLQKTNTARGFFLEQGRTGLAELEARP